MNDVLFHIESVKDPIISDPQPMAVVSFQAMMRKSFEPQSHLVNLRFDARADIGRQFEESGIERGVANLQSRAHVQGWRTRGRIPAVISRSDF